MENEETPFLKERRCLSINFGAVRALGEGTMIDNHGHQLSGAAKMTYIVYMFGKKVSDLDPELVKCGQRYVAKASAKMA